MKIKKDKTNIKTIGRAVIITAAITGTIFGFSYLLNKQSNYDNKVMVNFDKDSYSLSEIYVVSSNDDSSFHLCKADITDVENKVGVGVGVGGVAVGGNGSGVNLLGPNSPIGIYTYNTEYYNYVDLNTNDIILTTSSEEESDYEIEEAKKYISYDMAKENDYTFSDSEVKSVIEKSINGQK